MDKNAKHQQGFALPSIVIASIIMLGVLLVAMSSAVSIRSTLANQYYNRLAKEAAQSGIARANNCLKNNSYIAGWSNGSKLRPNTNCNGGAPCETGVSCFVMSEGLVRTSFTVDAPILSGVVQTIRVSGETQLRRASNNSVWKTYTVTQNARVGADISFDRVNFGYSDEAGGAYFLTISQDGKVRATGANSKGQLGIGSTSASLRPSMVTLPNGQVASSVATSFLSVGRNIFIVTRDGTVYGAGENNYGQLGNGTKTNTSTMTKFNLPSGKKGRAVAVAGDTTFVITTDNNIYAAGRCNGGMLGTNYTIDGCNDQTIPRRVALPAPTSSPNTQPTNNIVTDRYGAFVRMQGGAVYGWGDNYTGFLAQNNYTSYSSPVKIGDYGDSGKPKATQVAFDGDTSYIVSDDGKLASAGSNRYGQSAQSRNAIFNYKDNLCLDNSGNKAIKGNKVDVWTCNNSGAQEWLMTSDGHILNQSANMCIDDGGSGDTNGQLVHLWTCQATNVNQRWRINTYGQIINLDSGKCLDISDPKTKGDQLMIWSCAAFNQQRWEGRDKLTLGTVDLPASAGGIKKISTDQWFVTMLTTNNQVWGAGLNESGALGAGTNLDVQMEPVQFLLPSSISAKDIYTGARGYNNKMSNTFVIGSDDRIYGAGNNTYGQLGIGSTSTRQTTPVAMNVITGGTIAAKEVITGYGTTVVLTKDGKIYTVGNNNSGQLGDGTTNNSSLPRANRYTNVIPVDVY